MKHFRKALIVFFCIAFLFSTCVIPSSASEPCDCGEQYYMYDTVFYRYYLNINATYCFAEDTYERGYCRNCGNQWEELIDINYYEHNFVCGRCDECGYLQ